MNHISNSDAAWIAFAGLVPVILYMLFATYQTRQRMSLHRAVIEKFSSAADFNEDMACQHSGAKASTHDIRMRRLETLFIFGDQNVIET